MNNVYIIGDNLSVLKTIDSESVSLIYLDPPYNTGRNFNDFLDDFPTIQEYAFGFLQPRFIEIKRILKNNGNIVVHVEPKISHYVRLALDNVFGINNFRNEIVWKSGGNKTSKYQLARFHDVILHYSKTNKWIYNPEFGEYSEDYLKTTKICPIRNMRYNTTAAHNSQPDVNPRLNLRYEWNGHYKQWYVTKEKMQMLHDDQRLEYSKSGIVRFKKYTDELKGMPVYDLWTDIDQIQSGEKLDYATQKPVKLLERIIKMYSNEHDIIIDPFAGSGTTGRAAIHLNRFYILIDINEKGKSIFYKSLEK